MQYLVDTGIWLRLFDRSNPEHATILQAMRSWGSTAHTLATCPQNVAEFWNVSTVQRVLVAAMDKAFPRRNDG